MRLAYVVGTYPQPSETFIAREIAGLRVRGHVVDIYSLFSPAEGPAEDVNYGWPSAAARLVRRMAGAAPVARRWRVAMREADAVVAHFGSQPSTLALEAAGDRPFFLSLHARDIYVEAERLAEKIARAAAVVTCTRANADYLRAHFSHMGKIHCVYHGLPRVWLDAPVPDRRRDPSEPLRLLAVGRLVPKKGFGVLVDACARLKTAGVPTMLHVIGDGPLREMLQENAWQVGVAGQVDFAGWASEAAVRAACAWADVICCPSIITPDGDRDGLPNVLTEAMSTGLPAVGAAISGIPEAIEDGFTGLLTPPGDAPALVRALTCLHADPILRASLGAAAAARMRADFDGDRWLDVLEGLLKQYAPSRA
jgi:glycosyltransferase involved in cell wall biosynthesis